MKRFQQRFSQLSAALVSLLVIAGTAGCSDSYEYEKSEPGFLGASIYDYLDGQGNFKNYLRLVDDLNYREVLSLTGSKTVFPADDEAWGRFFQNNVYGVSSYDELTAAQKRCLLNSSMINMAYLSNMLANAPSTSSSDGEGTALRRPTSLSYLDSVGHTNDERQLNAPFWTGYQGKGLWLVDGESENCMVHFTPQHTSTNKIAESDMSLILGTDYNTSDIYINGIKVTKSDITCKNGYIHVLHDVMTPARNMSQVIATNGQTDLFDRMMNRFSAPYYSSRISDEVHTLYNGSDKAHPLISDSIFVKRYFTEENNTDPNNNDITNYGLLFFDPSDNAYSGMTDMGAMFVPTDAAMDDYLNGTKGRYLKDAYGSWDNVPTSLMALFVKNHQKKSFMSSLPSMWPTMNDESSFAMNVKESDIVKSIIATNGVVFVTNRVYPPIDYQTVYASVMTSNDTKIMNWALQDKVMKFNLYLRSVENMYNLLVPTDEALQNYRDPVSWAKGKSMRRIWAFRYDDTKDEPVSVDEYAVNDDGTKGAFKRTITDMAIIRNRLNDICDRHIIVGTMDKDGAMGGYIDDGNTMFAQSKGGSTLKVAGAGDNLTVTGGGDTEQGAAPARLVKKAGSDTPSRYDSDNGRTYFIDRVLQDPTNSVYTNMGAHEEFSKFFELLNGDDRVFTLFQNDAEIKSIFTQSKTSQSSGLGNVVSSFNNFRYTVFVPTNDAVDKAFATDTQLHSWAEIANQDDEATRRRWALHLVRFLKYHFMDNSIYIDGKPKAAMKYETAARGDNGRFVKLTINSDGHNMSMTDNKGNVAHVIKTAGLYNLQSRDFIVNANDYRDATQIVSSSPSVIHLIDRALIPE